MAAGAEGLGGAAAAGGGGILDALGAAGGGLTDLFSSAGGGLTDLFGGGAAGTAEGGLAGGGLSPAAAAGGLAPAGTGSVDLASSLAFAPEQVGGGTSSIFGGFSPGEVGFGANPSITGTNVALGGGFTPGEVGGFDLSALQGGAGGTVGGSGTGFGDITSLGGAGAAGPASDLASLPGVGGGAAGPGGGIGAAAGGANPAAAGGGGSFLDSLGTGAINSLTKNPLGVGVAAAGLGYNILQGNKLTQNQQNLTNLANQEAGQGQQLQQYLQNGTLPPGMQQQVDNAKAAARAQIISGYAARGQNANPSQNSALAQELAAVDTNALELQGKIATNLLTAGINETNMSGSLFQALIQMDQTQARQMGAAISNFASALAGTPRTIQIGGTATA